MHTKQDGLNKKRQDPSCSLQGQYQYLLTHYFVHAHKASQVKQATSEFITFIAVVISVSTYSLFVHVHKASQAKQVTSAPIISSQG